MLHDEIFSLYFEIFLNLEKIFDPGGLNFQNYSIFDLIGVKT